MLVNWSERKKPPISSTSRITRCGVSGRNSAIAASETALSSRVGDQHAAETEAAQDGLGGEFHRQRPECRGEGELAGLERVQPEARLQQQRQQERQGADAHPEQEAADDRGAERRQAQEPEVEHRVCDHRGVADVEQDADGAHRQEGCTAPDGDDVATDGLEAEHQPDQADGGQSKAGRIEARRARLRQIGNEPGHQDQAQNRDRHVDPEDPAPVEIGGDEAAEQGPDHGSDQGRHGEPGHRPHHLGLGDRAQQDQAPDRHHHRPAQALQDARRHQLPQASR